MIQAIASFLSAKWHWLRSLVDYHFEFPREPFQVVIRAPERLETIKVAKSEVKTKHTAIETLSELLDGLHGAFDVLKLPDSRLSFLHKRDMKALRITGVHVPSPWLLRFSEGNVRVDVSKGLPNTICIGIEQKSLMAKTATQDKIPIGMFFAIKQAKIPANYTQHIGTPYIFGYGWVIGDHPKDSDRLTWVAQVGTIDRLGEIRFCDELLSRATTIPCHRPSDRRRFGKSRTVYRKSWGISALFGMAVYDGHDLQRTMLFERNIIRQAFEWWSGRTSRWSVAVTKRKDRVTFAIDQENTKKFFVDRDKTVKARDGKAKRIIHYVMPHERVLANGKRSQVREHIRGIREFDWKEFHCVITAPKFHGPLLTAIFDLPPMDPDDIPENVPAMDQVAVARKLVDMEGQNRRQTIH